MIGHFDTVWNIDDLPLTREGNKLSGPGVYDMKYGIVGGIWAIKALQATGGLDGSLGLFFNSDEEMGSRTSRAHFQPIAMGFPNALILEPAAPDGAVKVGRKSTGDFLIKIHGIAAHAGTDYAKGRSAILEAAYLTQELFAMTDLPNGTSVNVGVISGGTKFNVVAAYAEMKVDVRVTKASEGERLTKLISALKPKQDGVTLEITGGMNRPPFEFTEANQGLFRIAQEAAKELGTDLPKTIVGGGSDGNFTSTWGIPTLDGLGPVGDGAHAASEHLMIQESLNHTAFLANLLSKL
jgi:glutamate carboxypeptidase